jgi:nucleoside phosphorylase
MTNQAQALARVDAAVITIREDEHRAVVTRLADVQPIRLRRTYALGRVRTTNQKSLSVAVIRIPEQGNGPAQDATRDVIEDLDPNLILVVGIAGAPPSMDFTLGDVTIAVRLADLRVQALRPDLLPQLEVRGERVPKALADILANLLPHQLGDWSGPASIGAPRPSVPVDDNHFEGPKAFRRKVKTTLERLFHQPNSRTYPIVAIGTVGSSDNLLRDPGVLENWQDASRKIQSIEMEAAGVFEAAARTDATYPVLVVRGTSDVVGYRREPEWTEYACQTAAAFAIALLRSGLLDSIRPLVSRVDLPSLTPPLAPASAGDATQTAHGILHLAPDLQLVNGRQELKVWIEEVVENLRMRRSPAFRVVMQNEQEVLAAFAKLDARSDLTIDERAMRLDTLSYARMVARRRSIVERFFSLLFGGSFGRWAPEYPRDYFKLILRVLHYLDRTGGDLDEEQSMVCHVESTRTLFLHARVPVTPDEVQQLFQAAALPDPLFLETREVPARLLPTDFRAQKVLPEILRTWLYNTTDLSDSKLEAEAAGSFDIDHAWFQLKKSRDII